jgi:hypothetical protein
MLSLGVGKKKKSDGMDSRWTKERVPELKYEFWHRHYLPLLKILTKLGNSTKKRW